MYIVLEDKDVQEIVNMIVNKPCSSDMSNSAYITIDDVEFEVRFNKEIEGYYEDEYNDGTGTWVTTHANVAIHDISACDVNLRVDYDRRMIENLTEELLTL
jgi:hypothetical protein